MPHTHELTPHQIIDHASGKKTLSWNRNEARLTWDVWKPTPKLSNLGSSKGCSKWPFFLTGYTLMDRTHCWVLMRYCSIFSSLLLLHNCFLVSFFHFADFVEKVTKAIARKGLLWERKLPKAILWLLSWKNGTFSLFCSALESTLSDSSSTMLWNGAYFHIIII